ncbi:MAG: hypothetical protein WD638_00220 [Nitriliruptoraceae bacterium]
MREPDWFDDEDDEQPTPTPRRRHLVLLLATVPWVLVAALLLLPDRAVDEGETTATDDAEVMPSDQPTGQADARPSAGPSASEGDEATSAPTAPTSLAEEGLLTLQEFRGRWRVAPGEEEAAALGVVIARASLTGLGPHLEVDGIAPDASTYAEHLVVEAVERPTSEVAVVTVLAVVLVDGSDGPARVELRRLAVPLATTGDGPRPVTAPWPLPAPDLIALQPDLEPLTDEATEAAAASALSAAGLGEHTIESLATADGWPVVANLSDEDGQRSVWLRPHLDGLVVAGTTLADHSQGTP